MDAQFIGLELLVSIAHEQCNHTCAVASKVFIAFEGQTHPGRYICCHILPSLPGLQELDVMLVLLANL